MKASELINKLVELEKRPTLYKLGTFMNKYKGKYLLSDCSGLYKGLLWGYPENGKYGSNGVADQNANTIISNCYDVSTNFATIKDGEIVWMPGHMGIYIGNGVVIESSPKWENGIQRTYCNGCGIANKEGLHSRTWKKHGKSKYIDYTTTVQQVPQKTITQIAQDVINGKYGNGETRKKRLSEAGYNYSEVQKEVNRLLKR